MGKINFRIPPGTISLVLIIYGCFEKVFLRKAGSVFCSLDMFCVNEIDSKTRSGLFAQLSVSQLTTNSLVFTVFVGQKVFFEESLMKV
jgi:hypothetical protein